MITLTDPDLGPLEFDCLPYTLVGFQIGWPAVREVMRVRALANGTVDDTRYSGARAVTIALRFNENACRDSERIQDLYDRVLPYMLARRRPVLSWSLPGTDSVVRQLAVRGVDAPMVIDSPKHPLLTLSFIASEGEITSVNQQCATIAPSGTAAEPGRTYPLVYPRVYPASPGLGARLITVGGNDNAHWVGTIFGAITNPTLIINGVSVTFNQNGGVALAAGAWITIDTRARTIYLNGDPTTPVYSKTNLTAWSWSDLLLHSGVNTFRFDGTTPDAAASFTVCWYDTWVN